LEDLEIVYWFTDDPGQSHTFYCDWAQMGCERVRGEFESLGNGEFALHIRFAPGVGELLPGKESGEVKVRFNREDWSGFNQADDYSFSGGSEYVDWEKATLYLEGALVWGRPPGQKAEAVNSTASPLPENPTPAPVLDPIETGGSPTGEDPSASSTQAAGGPATPASIPALRIWVVSLLAAAVFGFLIAVVWLMRRKH
jgi:hypothetical protein